MSEPIPPPRKPGTTWRRLWDRTPLAAVARIEVLLALVIAEVLFTVPVRLMALYLD